MDSAFKALAHPARRKILALLREREMSAGDIAEHFDFSKPTLSGHLALLKEAGLVMAERHGTTIVYELNISVSEEVVATILDLVGHGQNKRQKRGRNRGENRGGSRDRNNSAPAGLDDSMAHGRERKGDAEERPRGSGAVPAPLYGKKGEAS